MRHLKASKMADSLRRLVNIGTFGILQDKLEKWLDDYHVISCDQNVARCCEIVELNARVQGQLFKLLSVCASEGGMYGGASIIRSRLLPWLGSGFFASGGSVTADTSLSVLAEAAAKEREIEEIQDTYERSISQLESDLHITKEDNTNLQEDLEDMKDELNRSQRQSTNDKMFDEKEIRDLRAKMQVQQDMIDDYQRTVHTLRSDVETLSLERDNLSRGLQKSEDEIVVLREQTRSIADYEQQARRLREDIAVMTGRRNYLYKPYDLMIPPPPLEPIVNGYHDAQNEIITLRARASLVDDYERQIRRLKSEIAILRGSSYVGDLSDSLSSYRYLPRVSSPLAPDDATHRVRQSSAITRYNDLFSRDRLDAMDTLRRYSDDHENNQRIITTTMQEAFSAAKLAFQQFKSKVRSNLAATHYGPETLEEAVQDYINRNTDLYDLPALVSDVIRGLNRSVKISLPIAVDYSIINPFIREACKLAWQMSALAHPLDIALATDAELFDDNKYRRSYDSEYTAPLVNHHVWPCLMQGIRIITKGECVTRRGASLSSPRRSRSPSRPLSPSRSFSPSRARSRSPSPRRIASPDLGSSFSASMSGRSSPLANRPGSANTSRPSSVTGRPSSRLSSSGRLSDYN